MVSCGKPNENNPATNDTVNNTDTLVATDSSTLETTSDSLKSENIKDSSALESTPSESKEVEKQDSKKDKQQEADEKKKPSPNAKKIEKDLKWFEHDVKQYVQAVKYGMIGSELWELQEPCIQNEKNLKKYENEMTSEQKERFKKYQKMLKKY